jgi:hypothetical protein
MVYAQLDPTAHAHGEHFAQPEDASYLYEQDPQSLRSRMQRRQQQQQQQQQHQLIAQPDNHGNVIWADYQTPVAVTSSYPETATIAGYSSPDDGYSYVPDSNVNVGFIFHL